jgi:hypothetical protein
MYRLEGGLGSIVMGFHVSIDSVASMGTAVYTRGYTEFSKFTRVPGYNLPNLIEITSSTGYPRVTVLEYTSTKFVTKFSGRQSPGKLRIALTTTCQTVGCDG